MAESYLIPQDPLETDTQLETQEEYQPLDPLQLCSNGVCAALEPLLHEVSEDEEEVLELLEEGASGWARSTETAKGVSSLFYKTVDRLLAQRDMLPGGVQQFEHIKGYIEPNQLAQYRHQAQQHVIELGKEAGLENGLTDLTLLTLSPDTLEQLVESISAHLVDISKVACMMIPTPNVGDKIANMFEVPFIVETVCRVALASSIVEHPRFMKQVFDPKNITSLPVNVQRFAASDIVRGTSGSLILSLFKQQQSTEGFEENNTLGFGDRLHGHIVRNGLSEDGKNIVAGIAFGVKARGAPVCPGNSAGLCTQSLNLTSESDVPNILLDELERRESKYDPNAILALQKYATTPELLISKWWRSSERINYTIGSRHTAAPRKAQAKGAGKKAGAPTMQSVRESFLASEGIETEWASNEIARAAVYVPGYEQPVTAEADDVRGRKELLDKVMVSDEFADYLAKYSNDKENLALLLRTGIDSILFAPNYRAEKAINCIAYLPPYSGPDRKLHPIWRFSGRQSPLGTSKTGRQTRVYFWHDGEGDSRTVHIIGVRHKTAVEKKLKRSGDI